AWLFAASGAGHQPGRAHAARGVHGRAQLLPRRHDRSQGGGPDRRGFRGGRLLRKPLVAGPAHGDGAQGVRCAHAGGRGEADLREMIDQVRNAVAGLQADMVRWRRHLHQHPELSYQETNTVRFVIERLQAEGIEVRGDVGRLSPDKPGTGAIAYVRGTKAPSDACVALRADLDALPSHEVGDKPYISLNPGVMHACGHDAHTAMLLGAGIALHRLCAEWSGTVMLVFQPGEEKEPGGAA